MSLNLRLIIVCVALAPVAASADSTTRASVVSGKPTNVGKVCSVFARSCDSGPMPTISTQPMRGTLEIQREDRPVTNRSSDCFGHTIRGGLAVYTSTPGYHGPDRFVLTTELFNGRVPIPNYYTYEITVK